MSNSYSTQMKHTKMTLQYQCDPPAASVDGLLFTASKTSSFSWRRRGSRKMPSSGPSVVSSKGSRHRWSPQLLLVNVLNDVQADNHQSRGATTGSRGAPNEREFYWLWRGSNERGVLLALAGFKWEGSFTGSGGVQMRGSSTGSRGVQMRRSSTGSRGVPNERWLKLLIH